MVYVISKNGNPLMPCTEAKARKLLRDKKAKVVRKTPFTIKLLWDCEEETQEIVAGMDTGSKFIGCAVISNRKVLYQSEVQMRIDVSKKMKQRLMYRRTRRGRKLRYRKMRWQNRSSMRKSGRLAPSIRSKINSHLREKKFVESILPVTRWIVETVKFDIHKITNPNVKGTDYQEGNQKGFYNVKAYVIDRDGYSCQHCKGKTKDKKLVVHHIISRLIGTDSTDNLITLCVKCHDDYHAGKIKLNIKGKRSKTKHATEIGIVKSQLEKQWIGFEETFGYETKYKREKILGLPKSHINDAIAICCEDKQVELNNDNIYLKKHVSSGDYQQTKGKRSEKKMPTGKLFGLRKFDLVETIKGAGFVKGKRSTGFFVLFSLDDNINTFSVNVKKECKRISARKTVLIERMRIFTPCE
jgi:hypothetical protein